MTQDELHTFGTQVESKRIFCGSMETADHLLFHCPYAAVMNKIAVGLGDCNWRQQLQSLFQGRGIISRTERMIFYTIAAAAVHSV